MNGEPTGAVVSVNVGALRTVEHHGRTVTTGIFKVPVVGRVATHGDSVTGDHQADLKAHGGPERALYAYASEDLAWWSEQVGTEVVPGSMGENLTTQGIDVTNARVGERWRAGTVLVEVSAPRIPCFKLGIRMSDERFPQRFAQARRPGAYLRIAEHGELGAGDPVVVVQRPSHDVTVALVATAYHDDRSLAPLLLEAPQLPAYWRDWVSEHTA